MNNNILDFISSININFNKARAKPIKWEVRLTYFPLTLKDLNYKFKANRLHSFCTNLDIYYENNTKRELMLCVHNDDITMESNSEIDITKNLYIVYYNWNICACIDSIYFNYKNILPEVKQRIKELMCEYDEKVLTK